MKKIDIEEYTARKLPHYKKRRHRKKAKAKIADLHFRYCVRRWGIEGLMYSVYGSVTDLVYTNNPFLASMPREETFIGSYYPIYE